MKPQARIQAIIELLQKTQELRLPMDTVCGDYMRTRRYIGAKDRSFIAEKLYACTRHHARLGWWCTHLNITDTPRNRVLLYLVLAEQTPLSRLKDLFDGSNHAPFRLNDEEMSFLGAVFEKNHDSIRHKNMPEDVVCECPPLYAESLRGYFGKEFYGEMTAMLEPATLDLRVNVFLSDRASVMAALEKDGVKTAKTPYSPYGLRCENKAYLSRTKVFQKGWAEIQDEGSQMIAHLCGVKAGMQVLDFCAGGGGKTLALAAIMQRKGRIVAMDNDTRRLEKGRQRYKKSQIADIVEVRSLEDEKNRKWLRRQKEKFDVVLLDVPCSGSGTWRRNPDMRWNSYGPALEELTVLQAEILERAYALVKPDGALIYATCSLLPEENERQIENFLKAHGDEFVVEPIDPEIGIGSPYMRLTPLRHKTDGFFAARLKRKA
ncbi:MAG: RsmB/NOP family class I SAM-dependent RNA methyltransferase [Alphaproteobacteria bacterium]